MRSNAPRLYRAGVVPHGSPMKTGIVTYDERVVGTLQAALGAKSLNELFSQLVADREYQLAIDEVHRGRGRFGKNRLARNDAGERYLIPR